MTETFQLTKRLYFDYLDGPINDVIRTIRYDQHLSMIDKNEAQIEEDSLDRMVVEYVSDSHPDYIKQLEATGAPKQNAAKDKLLEILMTDYETELTKPVPNLVFGNLGRLLLIQIQQTKVQANQGTPSVISRNLIFSCSLSTIGC